MAAAKLCPGWCIFVAAAQLGIESCKKLGNSSESCVKFLLAQQLQLDPNPDLRLKFDSWPKHKFNQKSNFKRRTENLKIRGKSDIIYIESEREINHKTN